MAVRNTPCQLRCGAAVGKIDHRFTHPIERTHDALPRNQGTIRPLAGGFLQRPKNNRHLLKIQSGTSDRLRQLPLRRGTDAGEKRIDRQLAVQVLEVDPHRSRVDRRRRETRLMSQRHFPLSPRQPGAPGRAMPDLRAGFAGQSLERHPGVGALPRGLACRAVAFAPPGDNHGISRSHSPSISSHAIFTLEPPLIPAAPLSYAGLVG